jgi:hypothetical protein
MCGGYPADPEPQVPVMQWHTFPREGHGMREKMTTYILFLLSTACLVMSVAGTLFKILK